jgi:hypothetical protein
VYYPSDDRYVWVLVGLDTKGGKGGFAQSGTPAGVIFPAGEEAGFGASGGGPGNWLKGSYGDALRSVNHHVPPYVSDRGATEFVAAVVADFTGIYIHLGAEVALME